MAVQASNSSELYELFQDLQNGFSLIQLVPSCALAGYGRKTFQKSSNLLSD